MPSSDGAARRTRRGARAALIRLGLLALLLGPSFACGDDELFSGDAGDGDAGLDPPSISLELPTQVVPPLTEITRCWYTELPRDAVTPVNGWRSQLGQSSHGLQVFRTSKHLLPLGTLTADCIFADAAGVPAAWIYEANLADDGADSPVGTAMRMAAHQPLIVRLHAINSTDAPLTFAPKLQALVGAPTDIPTAIHVASMPTLAIPSHQVVTAIGRCPPPVWPWYRMSALAMQHNNLVEIADGRGPIFRSSDYAHPGEANWPAPFATGNGDWQTTCRYFHKLPMTVTTGGRDGLDELCVAVAHVVGTSEDAFCMMTPL